MYVACMCMYVCSMCVCVCVCVFLYTFACAGMIVITYMYYIYICIVVIITIEYTVGQLFIHLSPIIIYSFALKEGTVYTTVELHLFRACYNFFLKQVTTRKEGNIFLLVSISLFTTKAWLSNVIVLAARKL